MLYFTHPPEAPVAPIFTKFDLGTYLPDVIIYSHFHINQLRGFDFVRGRISPFPINKRVHRKHVMGPPISLKQVWIYVIWDI